MAALVVGRSVVGRALGQRRLPSRLGEADDDLGSDSRSFFLVLRYAQVDGVVTFGKSGLLLDKWDFGVGRIIPTDFPEARLNEAFAADAFACSVSAVCR